MTDASKESPYYAATAYRSDRIPNQPPSEERSWLKRFGKKRLPWGDPLELAPDDFMQERSPDKLRFQEQMFKERDEKLAAGTYVPAPYEHVDFHDQHNHEQFRFSLWSTRSQFWLHLLIFGKGFFLVGIIPTMITLVSSAFAIATQLHTTKTVHKNTRINLYFIFSPLIV